MKSSVEGDIDLRGILGLYGEAATASRKSAPRFASKGDAPEEKLRQIVEQSRARSAVFDVLTNGVPVSVEVSVDA